MKLYLLIMFLAQVADCIWDLIKASVQSQFWEWAKDGGEFLKSQEVIE